MRKFFCILSMLMGALVVFLGSVTLIACENDEVVDFINDNTDFELFFLEDVSQRDLSMFKREPGFGMTRYYNPKYELDYVSPVVYYDVTAYPDYADGGSYVTAIYCSDPEVTFFGGLTINSGNAIVEFFTAHGYDAYVNEIYPYDGWRISKGKIMIRYFEEKYIRISYLVGNREEIVF